MPIAKPSDFTRTVVVTIPGTDLQIRCRRPDLLSQVSRGVLPQPLLAAAVKRSQESSFDMMNIPPEDVATVAEFIDRWVCLAAVEPRIVMTEAEAAADAVWIDDLDLMTKLAVVTATAPNATANAPVTEFRDRQPGSPPPGSDGAPVRDTAVEPAPDAGPPPSA